MTERKRSSHRSKQDKGLTIPEIEALQDIVKWCQEYNHPYSWKQATMRKLEARGLVEKTGQNWGATYAYRPTEQGRAFYAEHFWRAKKS